jgi:hypothetical protein
LVKNSQEDKKSYKIKSLQTNFNKSQEDKKSNKNEITSNQIKVKGNNWIKIPRTLKNPKNKLQ